MFEFIKKYVRGKLRLKSLINGKGVVCNRIKN